MQTTVVSRGEIIYDGSSIVNARAFADLDRAI